MSLDNKYLKLISDYDKHAAMIAQASEYDVFERPDEKLKRIKFNEEEYGRWFEFMFNMYAKSRCAWFHIWLANLIIKHKRIRIIAAWFRSGAKSVHIDMGIPLYLHLVKHDLHFMLLIGETEEKAKALLSGIQAQFQYNKRLKNDYGELFNHGDWADGNFLTSDNVRYMALGFMQNPRGVREGAERPDYIAVDDVDSKRHVNNDRMMREAVDFITEDVWGCFDTDEHATERFIFANNNFHKNSITNRLKDYFKSVVDKKKEDKRAGIVSTEGSIKYVVSEVNAVKSLDTFEPNWPEKASAQYWREKFETMPYRSFMREYMGVHIQDGAIFKYEDIKFCQPSKLKDYDQLCFYGDLSYKDKGDFKALLLVGRIDKEFHIILSYLRRKSRADCAAWLYDMYEKHKLQNHNIRYYIEGLFAMDEFVSDFDAEGEKRGYYIPVVADKRPKSEKFDRIESLSGHFERHNVYFNMVNSTDQQTLLDQLLAFEKGSQANDDGPDALHGAIAYLNKHSRKLKTSYAFQARESRQY
jgi:predicted phage terminase large subunit-like protein